MIPAFPGRIPLAKKVCLSCRIARGPVAADATATAAPLALRLPNQPVELDDEWCTASKPPVPCWGQGTNGGMHSAIRSAAMAAVSLTR